MKRICFSLMMLASIAGYSQSVPDMQMKPQFQQLDNLLLVKQDFTYYAKNYDKVFGDFNFTNDANNFGARNVYVGYNGTFYYQGNSTYITEVPSNWPTYNFVGYQDVIGGLKNLSSLFTAEKDYSVKQP